jgi:hypothetical protein
MYRVVSMFMLILESLNDVKWHGIDELLERVKLSERKFREVIEFLDKYGFVKFDYKKQKVRINKDFRKVMDQETVA